MVGPVVRDMEDVIADGVLAEKDAGSDVGVSLEQFVVVWRNDGWRVCRRHFRELIRKIAHVQLVRNPRNEGAATFFIARSSQFIP